MVQRSFQVPTVPQCSPTTDAVSVNQPSPLQSHKISCRVPSKNCEYLRALTGMTPRRRNSRCCSEVCRRNWTAPMHSHCCCHRCPRPRGRRSCRPACRPLAPRWCSACGGCRRTCYLVSFCSDCPAAVWERLLRRDQRVFFCFVFVLSSWMHRCRRLSFGRRRRSDFQ